MVKQYNFKNCKEGSKFLKIVGITCQFRQEHLGIPWKSNDISGAVTRDKNWFKKMEHEDIHSGFTWFKNLVAWQKHKYQGIANGFRYHSLVLLGKSSENQRNTEEKC